MSRLEQALDAKGITQRDCARFLGVSEKTFYNKRVGLTEFTYGEAQKLKLILPEYDLDYLLGDIRYTPRTKQQAAREVLE